MFDFNPTNASKEIEENILLNSNRQDANFSVREFGGDNNSSSDGDELPEDSPVLMRENAKIMYS